MLDKRVTKKAEVATKQKKVISREHSKINIRFEINSTSNEIERFSISVLKTLINKGIPPTPDNFKIYFEKLLENKSLDFQKKIQELLEFEESNYSENRVEIEKDIKEILISINSIIKVVNSIYKNIRLIKQLSSETKHELKESNNSLILKNVAINFKERLDQFVASIDKQLESLQEKYQKVGKNFKNIEESTIFDTRFGVYNKRYFIEQAEKERQKIIKFKHESTIVVINIKDSILKKLLYQKDKIFLLRIIAKMLLKTSRRNDIISYFGENSFLLLLRHTNIKSAKMACERIYEMLKNSNIILNDSEVEIEVNIGIARINEEGSIEESIHYAFEAMEKAEEDEKIYEVYQYKEEKK